MLNSPHSSFSYFIAGGEVSGTPGSTRYTKSRAESSTKKSIRGGSAARRKKEVDDKVCIQQQLMFVNPYSRIYYYDTKVLLVLFILTLQGRQGGH